MVGADPKGSDLRLQAPCSAMTLVGSGDPLTHAWKEVPAMAAALEPGQLAELHERLERDRGALLADIDHLQDEDVSAESQYDSEFSGYGTHMAETGTEIFEQERSLAV